MKRKKQGASLIVVVILFMFISTVSMAMLSMVVGNYKARVAESKRVENLYASDSGLDVAYNIIGKTFDAATKYANLKVTQLKNTTVISNDTSIYNNDYTTLKADIDKLKIEINNLSTWNSNHKDSPSQQRPPSDIEKDIAQRNVLIREETNVMDILCNEEFKRSFKNFIMEHEYKEGTVKYDLDKDQDQNRLGSHEDAPNELSDCIGKNEYVSKVENLDISQYTRDTIEFEVKNKNNQPPKLEATVTENSLNNSVEPKSIKTSDGKDVTFTVYGDRSYDISVTSTFYTDTSKVNEQETNLNERKLQAKYTMKVPNYEDIYFQNSTGELHQYLATKDRALTILGDMNVNNATGLKVDGEIFVQGSDDNSTHERVYGKYFGGITVNNSTGVSFTKNVSTRGTFNIQDAAGVTIDENLYAKNIYAGKIENNSDDNNISGSSLNVSNQVIIDNDLALNLKNTKIIIKDFYGINDKADIDKSTVAAKKSSSIIINGNYNSTNLYITGSAYIMGVAHIATSQDYQTVESGAVKGNYIAYSVPLTDQQKINYNKLITDNNTLTAEEKIKYYIPLEKTEKFVYNDPLQLLEPDPDDQSITVQQAKENHFLAYWNEDGKNPDVGGIHWPAKENIWSVGTIVYKNEDETKGVVIPSRYKDDLIHENGDVYIKRKDFAKEVYKFGQSANISDYKDTIVTDFTSLINTDNIPSEYVLLDQNNKGEYAIFNGEESKEVKIVTSTDAEDTISSTGNTITIKVANKDNGHTINAVIASAGRISIESGITINGCIIAEGDLDITGTDVKINYDSRVIERVQSQNSITFKTFRDVFGDSIVDDADATTPDNGTNTNSATNYDLKNFLEDKSWKILK